MRLDMCVSTMRHVVHGVLSNVLELVRQRAPPMRGVYTPRCSRCFLATGLASFRGLRRFRFSLVFFFSFHLWLGLNVRRLGLGECVFGLGWLGSGRLLRLGFERLGKVVEAHVHALQGVERHALHFEGLNGCAHRLGVLL